MNRHSLPRVRVLSGVVWLEMARRKDIYVMAILLAALLVLLSTLDFFGLGQRVGYIKEIGLLTAWSLSCILAVTLGSRQLPRESALGTIYPLLAKPVSRSEVVVGKWFGAWTIVCTATLLFYGLVAGIVLARGGRFEAVPLIQAFALHACVLGILAALALLCSTRLNSDAAATLTYVAAASAFFMAPRIPAVLAHIDGWRADALLALYHILPHFEVFDMRQRVIHNYGAVPWSAWLPILLYGVLWIVAILLFACVAYKRKRLSRTTAS